DLARKENENTFVALSFPEMCLCIEDAELKNYSIDRVSVCHKHVEEETERVQQIVRCTAACCQVPRVACVENNRFRKSRTRQVIAHPGPKEERMFTASALQRRALQAPAFTLLAVLFAVALCAGPARADDDGEDGGAVRLLTTIPIPGTALRGFDISW